MKFFRPNSFLDLVSQSRILSFGSVCLLAVLALSCVLVRKTQAHPRLVLNTWAFTEANDEGKSKFN